MTKGCVSRLGRVKILRRKSLIKLSAALFQKSFWMEISSSPKSKLRKIMWAFAALAALMKKSAVGLI